MSVRINLEIGHEAAIRSKRTIDGFTHDWHVFVTGIDGADIQYYIDKVVFHLHETFPNPKRVVKEPPYLVKESGYAGFNLPIDIYLRNNEEPKKIRFNYDLNLQNTGPAIVKKQKEKYVFNNPSDEFRHKLIKGGGSLISSSMSENSRDGISSSSDKQQLLNKPKLSSSSDLIKKHKVKEHKAEDSFTDLFGTPITKTSKISPEPVIAAKSSPSGNSIKPEKSSSSKKSKSKHSPKDKDKDRDKEKKDKNPEKKHKEDKKNKERSKDKDRKDKNEKVKRERSPKQQSTSPRRSPKRSSSPPKRAPSPKRPPSPPIKPKIEEKKSEELPKEKIKSESSKAKREQKEKDKEKKEHKSHKEKDNLNRSSSEQKEHKSTSKEPKPIKEQPVIKPPKEKTSRAEEVPVVREPEKIEKPKPEKIPEPVLEKIEKVEKTKHKHKKKSDKEKKEEKKEKKEKKAEKKPDKAILFEKMYKEDTPSKESPREVEKVVSSTKVVEPVPESNVLREKASSRNLNVLQSQFVNDSSNSSVASHDESSVEPPAKVIEKPEQKKSKEKNKGDQSAEKKRKRKHEITTTKEDPLPKVEEPPAKIVREEPEFNQIQEDKKENVEEEITQDYMSILKDLQHKIMTLQDNAELQRVVQLIAETGHYEITAQTFDFDLCALDRDTVRRLQEFFTVS